MNDNRLRALERVALESHEPNDVAAWAHFANRMGARSLMPCLACHGCEVCHPECNEERNNTTPCYGSRVAPLGDSVVVGSILGIPSCEILAGWKPRDVNEASLGNVVEADWTTGEDVTPKRTRRPNLRERFSKLNAINAMFVVNRVIAFMAREVMLRKPTGAITKTRQMGTRARAWSVDRSWKAIHLLEEWALCSCPTNRKAAWDRYADLYDVAGYAEEYGLSVGLAPHLPRSYGTQTISTMAAVAPDMPTSFHPELESLLLGRDDLLRQRVEQRADPGIDSTHEAQPHQEATPETPPSV